MPVHVKCYAMWIRYGRNRVLSLTKLGQIESKIEIGINFCKFPSFDVFFNSRNIINIQRTCYINLAL